MEKSNSFPVEIAYAASPTDQTIRQINVKPDTSVLQAIKQSGLLDHYPDIDLNSQKTGVFSRVITLDTRVEPNWRIEIYRPLLIDPKTARRQRVQDNR